MLKKLMASAALAFAMVTAAGSANAASYRGDWDYTPSDSNYFEDMTLGDASDGTGLHLTGTDRFCVQPGDTYAWMHNVLDRNGHNGQQIRWSIDETCDDGYVRVCVRNRFGQQGCSTYRNEGWIDY